MTSNPEPPHSPSWQTARRLAGEQWSDPELVAQFQQAMDQTDDSTHWALIRWSDQRPTDGGLNVYLSAPNPDMDQATLLKLADLVRHKLSSGLAQSCAEKGWPTPRFKVNTTDDPSSDGWTYWLRVGAHRSAPVVIHPNKILAVGEEGPLSALLGLECVDPVFGLPAKWVTYSQSDRATDGGCLLFESSEVIMSHAIAFTGPNTGLAVHQWEVVEWASHALPSMGASASTFLQDKPDRVAYLVRQMIRESLSLPTPERFLSAVLEAEEKAGGELQQVESLVRPVVVNHNLNRWRGSHGDLVGIEWEAPPETTPEQHQRMLGRLAAALEEAVQAHEGATPLLLVEAEHRATLAAALSGLYPELPVVGWNELEDLAELAVVARVSAELEVEPSVMPATVFHVFFA